MEIEHNISNILFIKNYIYHDFDPIHENIHNFHAFFNRMNKLKI